jgi:hypothetical protein
LDPLLDDNGYPTNPDWLQKQGLDAVTLNRELVDSQAQQSQLLGILADPVRSAAFMQEYQRQLGATGYSPNQGRPDFPGGSPGPTLYMPTSANDIEFWSGRFQEIANLGIPPTPQHRAQLQQMWGEFPELALQHLVNYFPEY